MINLNLDFIWAHVGDPNPTSTCTKLPGGNAAFVYRFGTDPHNWWASVNHRGPQAFASEDAAKQFAQEELRRQITSQIKEAQATLACYAEIMDPAAEPLPEFAD